MRALLYWLARLLGDTNAASRGPDAVIRRQVRKSAYRQIGRWMR